MKKLMTKLIAAVLSVACLLGVTACGRTQVVGKEFSSAPSQLDAVMKLDKGEADVAVIDSVMASYYCSTGDYAAEIQMVENLVFAEETYGIAAKKGNLALVSKINEALIAMRTEDYANLLTKYNLAGYSTLTETTTDPYANATDNSWTDVVNAKKINIGYTLFAPIAYQEGATLTGFDVELAQKAIAYLNTTYSAQIEIEFVKINWETKEAKLQDGSIDLVWNGLTVTEERSAQMCISIPYLYNKQVAVILKQDAAKYTNKESMADAIMTAELGSAGEAVIFGE